MSIPPSFVSAIAKGGPFAIIAAGLMWIVYENGVVSQQVITAELKDVVEAQETIQEQHTFMLNTMTDDGMERRRQTVLLQKICINAADTNQERKDCLILE